MGFASSECEIEGIEFCRISNNLENVNVWLSLCFFDLISTELASNNIVGELLREFTTMPKIRRSTCELGGLIFLEKNKKE